MQNLAQLKKRLAETLANGGTVDFSFKNVTIYGVDHPGRIKYPEGHILERSEQGCKIALVQSNSFARETLKGTKSYLEFGKAANWEFPDKDTAICKGGSHKGTDFEVFQSLTYKFNQ